MEVEQEVPNVFVLVLAEVKDEFETGARGGVPQPNGVYYENVERKVLLEEPVHVRYFYSHIFTVQMNDVLILWI